MMITRVLKRQQNGTSRPIVGQSTSAKAATYASLGGVSMLAKCVDGKGSHFVVTIDPVEFEAVRTSMAEFEAKFAK